MWCWCEAVAAPTGGGIRESIADSLTEPSARARIVQHDIAEKKKAELEQETRNRQHFDEIDKATNGQAGLYDPTKDYTKEHTAVMNRRRVATAMMEQLGMSQKDADAYVLTGERMDELWRHTWPRSLAAMRMARRYAVSARR